MIRALKLIDVAVVAGALLGFGGVLLAYLGNPVNSGICVSCFMENLAGSLQLHGDVRMSYIRPELIGFVLGSFLIASRTGRFKVQGGSSPIIRFLMGFFIIAGCAVFIGCPIKMFLRLAAGDLTAIAATLGLIFGIWLGVRYIKKGFSLEGTKELSRLNGFMMPLFAVLLFIFLLMTPSFIKIGQKGPAAMRAPLLIALFLGIAIGALAQRSGLCVTGAVRNFLLVREKTLLNGLLTAFVAAIIASLLLGQFKWGMNGQPASHLSHGWTFVAMTLVGFASILIDGCPFRQLIKAGQGDVDACIASLGMLAGGALAYSWLIRSTSAGPTFQGKRVVMIGLIFSVVVAMAFRQRRRGKI